AGAVPPPEPRNWRAGAPGLGAGGAPGRDDLPRRVAPPREARARRMLRRFPAVHRWEQTDDVLQNAQLRLLRALQAVTPDSTRAFFGLAAEQIRRELLDLARRYARGPKGSPGNPQTLPCTARTKPAPQRD